MRLTVINNSETICFIYVKNHHFSPSFASVTSYILNDKLNNCKEAHLFDSEKYRVFFFVLPVRIILFFFHKINLKVA